MFRHIPLLVHQAIQLLNDAGYEAFLVGGCVRDSLMNKTPLDWDITTNALPTEIAAVFSSYRTIDTGINHGTVTVLMQDIPLEITTYRVDGTYSDGRHPDSVVFTRSLYEDLRRRDFTINAMAYHPNMGLQDPFGGQEDLKNGVIACVGLAKLRFQEDALRILRALRFAATLDFCINADTTEAIHQLYSTLSCISAERIGAEFRKMLCGNHPARLLYEFADVIHTLVPELNECCDFSLLDIVPPNHCARYAALFKSASLDDTAASAVLCRLRSDHHTIRNVCQLLSEPPTNTWTDAALLRLMNRVDPNLIFDYFAIQRIDLTLSMRVQQLIESECCYRISMLAVHGEDIVKAGIPEGPSVGKALQHLLDAVIDGNCPNEKTALLSYLECIE